MTTGRGIDHIGIAARSLDGLAAQYEALGFTLTPRAQHPERMGTSNRLVQFGGGDLGNHPGGGRNFIELIEVDRPDGVAPAREGFVSFGAYTLDFLGRREGMNLIVFRTDDRDADLERWKAAGLQTYAPFSFERLATLPDGTQVTVSFELAFVTDPEIDVLFFVCDNKAEAYFWKPEFQSHANGGADMHEVILCSEDPARHGTFLSAMFGGRLVEQADGIRVDCDGNFISVRTPDALAGHGWTHTAGTTAVPAGIEVLSTARAGTVTEPRDAGGIFIKWI